MSGHASYQQQQQYPYVDERSRLRYRYEQRTNERVYENGQRFPCPPSQAPYATHTPQVPRSVPLPVPLQGPAVHYANPLHQSHQYASPSHHSAYLAQPSHAQYPPPRQGEGLTAGFRNLSIASPDPPPPPPPPPPRFGFTPVTYEENGMRLVYAEDPDAQVRTLFGTTPVERITDPSLLGVGVRAHRLLMGTGGDSSEPLYSTFKLQRHGFFQVGRVFHVLWAEPAGETRTLVTDVEASDRNDRGITTGRHDEKVYSKVRRFVVVRAGENYCSALPIMSYGHRGVGKPGVTKHEHAIVHTTAQPPEPHPDELPKRGELPMRERAIRVVPDNPAEKLDPMSRIDFGRVHTVQHNIKTKSFGMVHQNSESALVTQFGNVWLGSITSGNPRPSGSQAESRSPAESVRVARSVRSGGSQPTSSVRAGASSLSASRNVHHPAPSARHTARDAGAEHDDDDDDGGEDDDDDDDDDEEDDDDGGDGDGNEDDEDAADDDEDDDEDTDEGAVPANTRDVASRARSTTSAETRVSENTQASRQACDAINRLRHQGYTLDQAFAVVMAKLQTDRGLTREAAYRLLQGWTGYRSAGSSAASTISTSRTVTSNSDTRTTMHSNDSPAGRRGGGY